MIETSREVARRFVLGRQGLWPGRRWRGLAGTRRAMAAIEHLQLDPLHIMARSQDLMLASRVLDYRPGDWERPTYGERRFFDWGGWLAVRPMGELPYFRNVMHRERAHLPGLRATERKHADAIDEMRRLLAEREYIGNRDFDITSRQRVDNYRGRKDSALALYWLWRVGEAMVHHRERFERYYTATERVAPGYLLTADPDRHHDDATDRFMLQKYVGFQGLTPLTGIGWTMGVKLTTQRIRALREQLCADGTLTQVCIEDERNPHWLLSADVPLLEALNAGRIPRTWQPKDTDTLQEAVFLAPLDPVSARGRAARLFDFDYVWEVYKPEHERRWGYYTLPILWGDRLVARFDGRLERSRNALIINRLWLEDAALGRNQDFAEALGRGMQRFADFLGARRITAGAISHKLLRGRVIAASRALT